MDRPAKAPQRAVKNRVSKTFFFENTDPVTSSQARFYSSDMSQRYVFADGGVNIRLGEAREKGSALGFTFANYSQPQGQDLIPTRVDVMRLRSSKTVEAKRFRALSYQQAFNGIDVQFAIDADALSQTIAVRPSAKVSELEISYSGVEFLKLMADGSMEVVFDGGKLLYSKPSCSERGLRGSAPLDCAYQLTGLKTFGISIIGERDQELGLTIQSEILAKDH
ncbi:MAG: hypothetical protein KDD66_11160 [Bdellovibrionales bacterium]|nr:hypothetical protein [Bdellovibrionales bacterium]